MPPTVATPNVIGEFEEDVKTFGGVAWGHRVAGGEQMVVNVPRGAKGPAHGTTAQKIMAANGIKAPKRPPPIKVPPPPPPPPAMMPLPEAAAAAAPAPFGTAPGPAPPLATGPSPLGSGSGKLRPPKLAAVIEERQPRGCCLFFRSPLPQSRPGPANDTVPPPPANTAPRPHISSASGRGAPSVMSSSFRQANQSIKRVPQSARSRNASARSRSGGPARGHSARGDVGTLSNWDGDSEGEFEELEDFIDEDIDSLHRDDISNASTPEVASSFSTFVSAVRGPSRAPSNAVIAYRESTNGNKVAPKSILKSAKRDSKQVIAFPSPDAGGGRQGELAGRSRVVLTDGIPEASSPVCGANPAFGSTGSNAGSTPVMATYGAPSPPGLASTSFRPSPSAGPSQVLAAGAGAAAAAPAGSPSGAGPAEAGAGGDWQLSIAASGGSGAVQPGRNGPSSIKLTAEELLGLLMAQGKLTEHDVQELGLAPGAELRGSPAYASSSPTCHSPAKFAPGSAGGNCATLGGGGSPVPGASAAQLPSGLSSPALTHMAASENNISAQRVRFSASQLQVPVGFGSEGGSMLEMQPPCLVVSASHRVRFGDDEAPAAPPVAPVRTPPSGGTAGEAAPADAAAVKGNPVPVAEERECFRRQQQQQQQQQQHKPPWGEHVAAPGLAPPRQRPPIPAESLDLEEVLESTALRLESSPTEQSTVPVRISGSGAPRSPQGNLAARPVSPAGALGPPPSGRSPRAADAEALRLGPPDHPPGAVGPSAYRGPQLRASDSGIMRTSGHPPGQPGGSNPAGGGHGGGSNGGAAASPRAAHTLRLSTANAPPHLNSPGGASLLAGGLAGLSPSRPGSAGSNNSITPYNHWAPHAVGTMGFGSSASATVPGTASMMYGSAGGGPGTDSGVAAGGGGAGVGGGRAGGSAGPVPHASGGSGTSGGMGAVDRLAMRKLQSHMNRSSASRHTVSSGGESMCGRGGPMRQPSHSNWMAGQGAGQFHPPEPDMDSDDGGPGTPDREGADARCRESELSRPSVRSVRFTAPVVFELRQSGDLDGDQVSDGGGGGGAGTGQRRRLLREEDGEEEAEREAVAAAAAAAARSRILRSHPEEDSPGTGGGGDLLWQSTVSGTDKSGAWM